MTHPTTHSEGLVARLSPEASRQAKPVSSAAGCERAQAETFDVVVVGGGPCGATVADDLAQAGYSVALLDRAGRIKPCGGAIPPRLITDFEIPDELLVAKIRSARMISPSDKTVDMPIDGGFVGMVDRDVFDEWLRARAARHGATRLTGTFEAIERDDDGLATVVFEARDPSSSSPDREVYEDADTPDASLKVFRVKARLVIGADGARSKVGRLEVPGAERVKCVFAYHEIIERPANADADYAEQRCDVYYQGHLSPDFYAWVFPHGKCASIGVGSAQKGFSLRGAVGDLRRSARLDRATTLRKEGAPIPLKPLKRWDNGRDVLLAGDAAGVVAPASGEGIYYAMLAGRLAGHSAVEFLRTGDARALKGARKAFMKEHGRVFFILGLLQRFWYSSDKRREQFVSMCRDPDVQRLTWESYMHKKLVRRDPWAHVRVFVKDVGHLLGMISPWKGSQPAERAETRS
ncbi:MAG: geranylgeranyl diphosphate reductase [Hyphomicrobiaceae bacterium]